MKTVRKPPSDEAHKRARHELKSAISSVQFSEEEIRADIRAIAGEVKRNQKAQMKEQVTNLLISSRSKRQRLGTLSKHRRTLEQQYDALDSVELNEKVMSSVRQTSSALKALGLDAKLNDIDETMMDLNESTEAVSGITDILHGGLSSNLDWDDEELDMEMSILMGEEGDPTQVAENPSVTRKKPTVEATTLAPVVHNSTTEDATEASAQEEAQAITA